MGQCVRALLDELASSPVLVFPDWDVVVNKPQPFKLHSDISADSLGANQEQDQSDGSTRVLIYIRRATLDSERSWMPMKFEADCAVWSIRRL